MYPVADAARPSNRHAGQKAGGRADGVAAELKFDGGKNTIQQFWQIVGIYFDDRLWRRKERQRQPCEFCGRELPQGQKQSECQQPRRTRLQARSETAEPFTARCRRNDAAGDDKRGDRKCMGTRPIAQILPQQAREPEANPRRGCGYGGSTGQKRRGKRQRTAGERGALLRRLRQRNRLRRRIRRHKSAPQILLCRCSA